MQKEHPILFSTPMVQAILEGRKTQTRRIIKHQPYQKGDWWHWDGNRPKAKRATGSIASTHFDGFIESLTWSKVDNYGKVGETMWVRETWAKEPHEYIYRADEGINTPFFSFDQKWKPGIHMPRVACRLILEINNRRVQKLHDITPADAIAEGIARDWDGTHH